MNVLSINGLAFQLRSALSGSRPQVSGPLDRNSFNVLDEAALGHAIETVGGLCRISPDTDVADANRAVGFVQGCLWVLKIMTVAEMAEQVRTAGAKEIPCRGGLAAELMASIARCVGVLEQMRIDPCKHSMDKFCSSRHAALGHAAWMLAELPPMIEAGKLLKASRWTGFVEGCLWLGHVLSLAEIERSRTAAIPPPA
jgi:hypothetical protein